MKPTLTAADTSDSMDLDSDLHEVSPARHSAIEYPLLDVNAFGTTSIQTFNTPLQYAFSEPFKIPNRSIWTEWHELENPIDISPDNYFSTPGFGSLPRAPSVGSGHVSIGSAGSSNHSWSSWRGRSRIKKVFSRGSSIAGRAKSAMKDGMSSWSLNGTQTHVSPSPRRTGKLTDVARAGMRLLKGQGACWKCKILKKTVRKSPLNFSLSY